MSIIEYTGPSNPQEIRKYLMRRTKDEIVWEYLRQWREYGELEAECDALAAKVAELEAAIKFQASAAKRGMNAAKEHGAHMEVEARRLHAECSPEALESERQANAQLTVENEALTAYVERLTELIDQAAEGNLHPADIAPLIIRETPATSLARRDALKQAEALESLAARYALDDSAYVVEVTGEARCRAAKLRRHAKGGNKTCD